MNPNDVVTLRWLAWEESNWGLGADALRHAKRALQLSPRDPILAGTYWQLALAAYVTGDLEAAIEYGHQSLAASTPTRPECLGLRTWRSAVISTKPAS